MEKMKKVDWKLWLLLAAAMVAVIHIYSQIIEHNRGVQDMLKNQGRIMATLNMLTNNASKGPRNTACDEACFRQYLRNRLRLDIPVSEVEKRCPEDFVCEEVFNGY